MQEQQFSTFLLAALFEIINQFLHCLLEIINQFLNPVLDLHFAAFAHFQGEIKILLFLL